MAPAPPDRLDTFLAAAGSLVPTLDGVPVAIGWATIELDRAVPELAEAISVPTDAFAAAADDSLLGARCRVARGVLADGRSLVVLGPATEGRLAATLARNGEGPAAIWLVAAEPSDRTATAAAPVANVTLSSARSGPLGSERLVLGGPIHGPHRLLIGVPGTIRP